MAAQTRIYTVAMLDPDADRKPASLVRAPTAAQALRHVAADSFEVSVATPDELIDLTKAGVEVEVSGDATASTAIAAVVDEVPQP